MCNSLLRKGLDSPLILIFLIIKLSGIYIYTSKNQRLGTAFDGQALSPLPSW